MRQHINRDHLNCIVIPTSNNKYVDPVVMTNEVIDEDSQGANSTGSWNIVDKPVVDEYGISQAALKFLLTLMASNSLPASTADFVKNCSQELLQDILGYLQFKTASLLTKCGCDITKVNDLMSEFESMKNPFKGIDSQHMLLSYLKMKNVYIEPEEKCFGKRWDVKRDPQSGKQIQVEVEDKFYYIPIERTIKLVLQQKDTWKMLNKNSSVDGIVDDWLHGDNGKKLTKYCERTFPLSTHIYVQIYFDEVETTNPIGSKTGIHKLGAFYFVIKNFPPAANSALSNIHLLALCHADDIKKHKSVDPVLNIIISELNQLHDEGFSINVSGEDRHIRCFLTQFVGENLGLHSILGYMENFSRATFPCDICMATTDDIQQIFSEKNLTIRTEDMYNQQVQQLIDGEITSTDCGIKRPSITTKLKYYHPSNNDAVDIMHDLFEGVIPCEMKLFINYLVYEKKCITLGDINYRIKSMDYGSVAQSKPRSITESHLKSADALLGQRSAQTLTLFLYLPLIIADIIDKADPLKWRLYQLLKQITDIILSPSLSSSHVSYLQDLVCEHHDLFKICYPEKKFIYKHHRMIHYARLINRSGPLLHMMVMRFEAKHNFSKRLAHVICNFQNISYSLSKRHQLAHALTWMTKSPLANLPEIGFGSMITVSEIRDKHLLSKYIEKDLDIFVTNRVVIFGQEYKINISVLCHIDAEGEPTFMQIDQIYVHNNTVYFIGKKWIVHEYNQNSLSYCCTLDSELLCVTANQLFDYKPFHAVQCSKPECPYEHIVLRHQLCDDNSLLKAIQNLLSVLHDCFYLPVLITYGLKFYIYLFQHFLAACC